jgi:hypothetical protein
VASGKTKLELRGHDNVVSVAVFVPSYFNLAVAELILNKVWMASHY